MLSLISCGSFLYKCFTVCLVYFQLFINNCFYQKYFYDLFLTLCVNWKEISAAAFSMRQIFPEFRVAKMTSPYYIVVFITFLICCLLNIKRIIRDKQAAADAQSRKADDLYEDISAFFKSLLAAQRTKLSSRKLVTSRGRKCARARRALRDKSVSGLWKKLYKLQGAGLSGPLADSDVKPLHEEAESVFERDSFIPPVFHSTERESAATSECSRATDHVSGDSICGAESGRPTSPDQPIRLLDLQPAGDEHRRWTAMETARSRRLSLSPTPRGDAETSANFDSGYHNNCRPSLPAREEEARDFLREVEVFNEMRDRELPRRIHEAQMQVRLELESIKEGFRLPREATLARDCPELTRRRRLLEQVKSRIEAVKKEIEESQKNCFQLSQELQPEPIDTLRRLKVGLAREQEHAERYDRASKAIVRHVRDAMETRFRGMCAERKEARVVGRNWCYDCASGCHRDFFIDGLDERACGAKILTRAAGFDEACTVVMVINGWYSALGLSKVDSMKTKADKTESLLGRVLREMYVTRYYKRGQLMSEAYRTVGLRQFVCISSKDSVSPGRPPLPL